jgi:hypothetical protein
MALLLDRRHDQVQVTEDVVKAAKSNRRDGEKLMALLVKATAGNSSVLTGLLDVMYQTTCNK